MLLEGNHSLEEHPVAGDAAGSAQKPLTMHIEKPSEADTGEATNEPGERPHD